MKKLFMLAVFMLGLAPAAMALITDSKQFVVSATVPAASGINIVATQVSLPGNVFGASVTAMDFNPLTFDSTNGIWIPNHYFAVDVGASNGAGNPNITVSYGSESKPAGQVKGLGFKSTATFVKITGPAGSQVETPLAAHGPKKLLNSIAGGENITAAEISGGFFRVYVGLYTGDNAGLNTLGGEPFTNGDKPGTYQGTLTVSATIP
jgi:hypothetical protein